MQTAARFLLRKQKIMTIQTENSPSAAKNPYRRGVAVAKDLASPRESRSSELVPSRSPLARASPQKGSAALPKQMTGLWSCSQKLTTIFLWLEAKEECNEQARPERRPSYLWDDPSGEQYHNRCGQSLREPLELLSFFSLVVSILTRETD